MARIVYEREKKKCRLRSKISLNYVLNAKLIFIYYKYLLHY